MTSYARYKEKTRAFRDGLARLLPSNFSLKYVADLGNASEFILNKLVEQQKQQWRTVANNKSSNNKLVNKDLLANLEESIELREQVATAYGENHDDGHEYMLAMLKYCRGVLYKAQELSQQLTGERGFKIKSVKTQEKDLISEQEVEAAGNRFDALELDDDIDADDEALHSVGQDSQDAKELYKATKPKEPERKYSIEDDLINGSTSFHALLFLYGVDVILANAMHHLKHLKSMLESKRNDQNHDGASGKKQGMLDQQETVVELMKIAAVINVAIDDVRSMERSLFVDCPQVSKSFYHVLAAAFWRKVKLVAELDEMIDRKRLAKKPNMVLDFIAKCIEVGFRLPLNAGLGANEDFEDDFARESGIDVKVVKKASTIVILAGVFEVGSDTVKAKVQETDNFKDFCVRNPGLAGGNTWLENYNALSGDNNILHTHSLLQGLTTFLPRGVPQPEGTWPSWDENRNPAKSTSDACFDRLLLETILPELFSVCGTDSFRKQMKTKAIPETLFPLYRELMELCRGGDKNVPLSASFAVHAMFMGFLTIQGDSDLQRTALQAKLAYDACSKQVKDIVEREKESSMKSPEQWLEFYNNFPVGNPKSSMSTRLRAFWNPLVAGNYLLFTSYVASIKSGANTINRLNQACVCFHLYHALLERGLMERHPVMDGIFGVFSKSKAIWRSTKPSKGHFTKTFLLAIGDSLRSAGKVTEILQRLSITEELSNRESEKEAESSDNPSLTRLKIIISLRGSLKKRRHVIPKDALPSEMSTSFKYTYDRDFSGVAKIRTPGLSSQTVGLSGSFAHVFHATVVVNSIDKEVPTLMTNWVVVGALLNEFLDDYLIQSMDWGPLIKDIIAKYTSRREGEGSQADVREVLILLLIDNVFSELDFVDEQERCENSKKVAQHMTDFFNRPEHVDGRFWASH